MSDALDYLGALALVLLLAYAWGQAALAVLEFICYGNRVLDAAEERRAEVEKGEEKE